MSATRRAELADNLAAVQSRIARACEAAGRDQAEVRLIVVTKNFPASDVHLLAELGV
ncbi:MAG: YggS family pyridoxal phosphate-dependent enzyme, partial [Actinobacteria bacterium]|nr:YggS family pyridoxal phosphate-dependent enzyme [Actinomycetota bacterium]